MPWRVSVVPVLLGIALMGAIAVTTTTALQDRTRQKERAIQITGGNPDHAMQAIVHYGCASCHDIPGAQMPGGLAASSLSDLRKRIYLGGRVNNTPENLTRWITNPKQFDPLTAMPVTGISEDEARDISAFLYQHG